MAWKDLPFRPIFSQDAVQHAAGAPPWCTVHDLTLTPPPPSGPGFDVLIPMTVTARPGHRCALQGIPTLTLSIGTWSLAADPPDLLPRQPSIVLSEGHPSIAGFQWSGPVCSGPPHRTLIEVELPHHGGRAIVPWTTSYACPELSAGRSKAELQADPLGTHSPQGDPTWATPFVTRLVEQHTVQPGGILHYQVQLSMLRGAASTPPCYGYRETLRDALTYAVVANEQHTLYCTGQPPLDKYGTVWDMEVRVPVTVPVGTQLTIGWECDIPNCANEASPKSDYVTVTSS